MAEAPGDLLVKPQQVFPHESKASLTLKETRVLQKLETGFKNEKVIPEIRKQRAQMIDSYIDEHIKQLVEKSDPSLREEVERKAVEVKKFFTTHNQEFGMTPFERIAQIYEHLEVPIDPKQLNVFNESLQGHAFELAKCAFDQHSENPEQYVSHGFDHSIRVANYQMEVIENFPNIIAQIVQEYNISPGKVKFIVENAALFHDCGYCSLASSSSKVAHSVGSLRIIGDKKLQQHIRHLIAPSTDGEKPPMFNKLMYDLEGAVLFHNSDLLEKSYHAKVTTTMGEWLGLADEADVVDVISHYEELGRIEPESLWFKMPDIVINVKSEETRQRIEAKLKEVYVARGFSTDDIPTVYLEAIEGSTPLPDDLLYHGRRTDLKPGDKRIGVEYKEADTLEYSLLALLRVSDNLDLLSDRFSRIQRVPAFQQIYRKYYGRDDLAEPGVKNTIIAEVLDAYPTLPTEDREKIRQLGLLLDGESFKHFGGCEPLKSVVFRPSPEDPSQAEIVIYADRKSFEELQKLPFKVKTKIEGKIQDIDVNIAEFQIWRLKETVKVNFHGGKPINIRVLDEEGNDMTQNTFLQTGA